ncbi:MAG: hypothetical protein ACOX2F_08620 [bacterium]
MKTVFILILILVASCNSSPSKNDETLFFDNDVNDEETSDSDNEAGTDANAPACLNEWEKTEIVEDVNELFDFNVKVETGKWKWDKKDGYDELIFNSNPVLLAGVMNDGSLVLGDNFETEEGYSFVSVLNPDGTFKRYVLEIEKGSEVFYGQGELNEYIEPFDFWFGLSFDEKKQEILVSAAIKSKIKASDSGDEHFVRPFIIKIDAQGDLTYIAWKSKGNSVCNSLIQIDDKIIAGCVHWSSDLEIYAATKMINAEINVVHEGHVYRNLKQSDFYAQTFPFSVSNEDGKVYIRYDEIFSESYEEGFIYAIDELDLCVESISPSNFYDEDVFSLSEYKEDTFSPHDFIKKGEYSITVGRRSRWEHDYEESRHWMNHYPAIYFNHPNKDRVYTFGIKDPHFEMEGKNYIHANYMANMYPKKGSDMLFVSTISTFDMEDKGRDWITPELLEKTKWPFQPSIMGIDPEKGDVYIKHFFVDDVTGNSGTVYSFGDYLYLIVLYVAQTESGDVFENILYRFPESWLINEESKAKETRLWVESY